MSSEDWDVVRLIDLAEYQNGRATKPSEARELGMPVVKIRELSGGVSDSTVRVDPANVEERHLIDSGDLLFAWSASLGIHVWNEGPAALNQHIFKVTASEGTDQRFLRYLLEYQLRWLIATAAERQTTMGHVRKADLERLTCRRPPLGDQRAIAEVLGALDERIEWCEDLIRACIECQECLFSTIIADARFVRLGDWAHFEKGVSYKGSYVTSDSSDRPLLNLGLFGRESRLRWENLKYYSGAVKERHAVRPGDVVVCATDMTQDRAVLGRVAVVPNRLPEAAITHHLFAMRVRDGAPFPAWVAGLAISHEPNRRRLAATANGTTVLALPKDIVEAIEVPVPTQSAREALDDSFWALQELVEALDSERTGLATLRDSLLRGLLSGEVRIPNPQALLEPVA